MVAAAVVLPDSFVSAQADGWLWPELGARIDDSKRLSPAMRERAFARIIQHAHVGVGIVPADRIDAVNIFQATLGAMSQAIDALPQPPELILVDGQHAPPSARPCWPFVDGDRRSYLIACASIVAKVVRDRLMCFYHRLFPAYGFDEHKGYGTPAHLAALAAHGPCALHRQTFHPVAQRLHPAPNVEPSGLRRRGTASKLTDVAA